MLIIAALVLAGAIVVGGGTFSLVPMIATIVSYAIVLVAVFSRDLVPSLADVQLGGRWVQRTERLARRLRRLSRRAPVFTWFMPIAAVVITGITAAFGPIGPVSAPRAALASAALLALYSIVVPLARRRTWLLVTILASFGTILAIRAHTPSDNDVWFIVQGGADAILRGDNPFDQCWPGNPDTKTDCVYPYLPATSVVLIPFRILFGDVRYGYIVALAIASYAVFLLAHARYGIALGTVFLVVGAPLADRAWTEPLIIAAIATMVWGATSGRVLAILGLATALALKQHIFLLLPLAMWWPVIGPAPAIGAAAIAALTALPWFLANPGAFVADTLWFHLGLQPRLDSSSLYALLTVNGVVLPPGIGALLVIFGTVAALVVAMVRLPRDRYGFALGAAFVMFTFNLLNKQTFYNHHALVVGLLVIAVAIRTGQQGGASAIAWSLPPSPRRTVRMVSPTCVKASARTQGLRGSDGRLLAAGRALAG